MLVGNVVIQHIHSKENDFFQLKSHVDHMLITCGAEYGEHDGKAANMYYPAVKHACCTKVGMN
jgi:hypothetical protein